MSLGDGNVLLTLVALFSVMGIPSLPPVFLAVTESAPETRRKVAIQSALAIGLIMLVSFAIGQYLLELFGIQFDAFKVAGALVVGSMAWGMITAKPSALLGSGGNSPAIIPLAIPKTAGPGANPRGDRPQHREPHLRPVAAGDRRDLDNGIAARVLPRPGQRGLGGKPPARGASLCGT